MRVAFIGCRDWTDDVAVRREMDRCIKAYGPAFVVVTGCARGADESARLCAERLGRTLSVHRAEWDRLGKRAGHERNGRIVADADAAVAFWDGKSPGTRNCIEQFVQAGKPVRIVPKRRP